MRKYGSRPRRRTNIRRRGKRVTKRLAKRRVAKRASKPEVKFFQQNFGTTYFNANIANPGDILGLIPTILSGTQNFNRIGNKIFVKSMKVRMNICWQSPETIVQYGKIGIRAMIGRPRYTNESGKVNATDLYQLLRVNNVAQQYDGTIVSYQAPIHSDYWKMIMDKRIPMKNPMYIQVGAGPLEWSPTGRRTVVKTVLKNKTLRWATGIPECLNFPYVMMFGFSPLDNISVGSSVNQPFTVNYTVEIRFTDV